MRGDVSKIGKGSVKYIVGGEKGGERERERETEEMV